MTSGFLEYINYTNIAKDRKGYDTYYFIKYFKNEPSLDKKVDLNDLLKFFAVKNKKTVVRKEDVGKKYAEFHGVSILHRRSCLFCRKYS